PLFGERACTEPLFGERACTEPLFGERACTEPLFGERVRTELRRANRDSCSICGLFSFLNFKSQISNFKSLALCFPNLRNLRNLRIEFFRPNKEIPADDFASRPRADSPHT
ncbi:MAG: hypothetical protein HY234_07010, partial [Acidobacteria bacterium]|nr:hypothetical protein [Acidobacteriota bacterium]